MTYDELLEDQKEELEDAYEIAVENGDTDLDFFEWAEGFTYGDDDFSCTAGRSRCFDLMVPYSDPVTLYEDDLRALEQFMGKVINDGKELLETLSRLVQREVEAYAA